MRLIPSNFTFRGSALLGLELGLILVGILLKDGALITLGVCLFIILLGAIIFGRRNIAKLKVELDLPHRVHAHKSFSARARIINQRAFLDTYNVDISIHLPQGKVQQAKAKWIPSKCGAEYNFRPSIPMRASVLEMHYELVSRFPFGLFTMRKRGTVSAPLLVYPRLIIPRELLSEGTLSDLNPNQGSTQGDALGEPRGIRPWQPGDPAKKIHWPASARSLNRGHGLRVRENDPPGFQPEFCHVIYHSFGRGEVLREDRFERALSLLAGTLSLLMRHNVAAKLQADFLGWSSLPCQNTAQYQECLAIMAETKRAQGTESHELQSALKLVERNHSCIIISDMTTDAWLPSVKLPHGTMVIDIRQIHFQRPKTNSPALSIKHA
ncbi:Uncharacterized conserved protein, DUF58 family, contains vWF domain [Rubritalea squalenifaciens DSM 18772]|uniref:Uncharacterized conserved protein, DUF58 family, contains vWF domain n=1 Tax=Rubritalea squalenifaciens DSM 18772 TaxID=1123071 RepID=A0A1M6B7H8_9BACT|nr:DUF58 domain-containing protein [Rubritalea squalenifaciens]SHI44682.1 Uncharacterized conserved protein, DUF58 family, contains vWF domain [Rubritalea squalenifaciens DSM 18772]